MSKRQVYAQLLEKFVADARGAALHVELLYALVAGERPDLIDDTPDPHAPDRPKWQHELRWEIQSAVGRGTLLKRSDIGRGYYSSGVGTGGERRHRIRVAAVEKVRPEPYTVQVTAGPREALRAEALLVRRYANWMTSAGHTLGRVEIRTDEGDRLVADASDPARHLLIEAKSSVDRASIRMALGQLFDYRHLLGTRPRIAVLIPQPLGAGLHSLLQAHQVGIVVETQVGVFDELLTEP